MNFPPWALAEILYQLQSEYQEILLTRDHEGSIFLYLDGYLQFDSRYEHIYHEVLVDFPMVIAPEIQNVLVLGGGDGLAVRNVLRYPVQRTVLCEIDPFMIEMTRNVEEMVALSQNSLRDPRVTIYLEDAEYFLGKTSDSFDVVMCDFPAATQPWLAKLFTHSFFLKVVRVLREESVLSMYVGESHSRYWEVYLSLAQILPWVVPLSVKMETRSGRTCNWGSFILASAKPRRPLRVLPQELSFLTPEKLPQLVIRNFDFSSSHLDA